MGEQWVANSTQSQSSEESLYWSFIPFFIPTWSRQKYTQFTSGVEDQQDLER